MKIIYRLLWVILISIRFILESLFKLGVCIGIVLGSIIDWIINTLVENGIYFLEDKLEEE